MTQNTETNIQRELRHIFESFGDRYVIDGQLKKDSIITALDNYDPKLISSITSNEVLNNSFTTKIKDVTVIKINEIIHILEADEYWTNSYTKYLNKIGLTSHNRFLEEFSEVVLDFPYKDTILKAGMSKGHL